MKVILNIGFTMLGLVCAYLSYAYAIDAWCYLNRRGRR